MWSDRGASSFAETTVIANGKRHATRRWRAVRRVSERRVQCGLAVPAPATLAGPPVFGHLALQGQVAVTAA